MKPVGCMCTQAMLQQYVQAVQDSTVEVRTCRPDCGKATPHHIVLGTCPESLDLVSVGVLNLSLCACVSQDVEFPAEEVISYLAAMQTHGDTAPAHTTRNVTMSMSETSASGLAAPFSSTLDMSQAVEQTPVALASPASPARSGKGVRLKQHMSSHEQSALEHGYNDFYV